jgi:hypothetical protein
VTAEERPVTVTDVLRYLLWFLGLVTASWCAVAVMAAVLWAVLITR